jgi:hypothetical protein
MVRSRVLADVLGISERQVAYHAGSGVLPRNEKSLYPLRASIQAYCAHLRGGRGGESGTTLAQ